MLFDILLLGEPDKLLVFSGGGGGEGLKPLGLGDLLTSPLVIVDSSSLASTM